MEDLGGVCNPVSAHVPDLAGLRDFGKWEELVLDSSNRRRWIWNYRSIPRIDSGKTGEGTPRGCWYVLITRLKRFELTRAISMGDGDTPIQP